LRYDIAILLETEKKRFRGKYRMKRNLFQRGMLCTDSVHCISSSRPTEKTMGYHATAIKQTTNAKNTPNNRGHTSPCIRLSG